MAEETTTMADIEPVACSLSEGDLARRGRELAHYLFAFAERVEELKDGYA